MSAEARPFDVFLSHNSRDKPLVEEIGDRLKSRGLRVWLPLHLHGVGARRATLRSQTALGSECWPKRSR